MLGGFYSLRLSYSKDILQQAYQSDTQVEAMVFLEGEKYIASWDYAQNFVGDLKIESAIAEFVNNDKFSFKAVLEVDVEPMVFDKWYNQEIRNQRLALELSNNNNFVRVINPFTMDYTYIGNGSFENVNRYELTFQRTRLIENYLDLENNLIDEVGVVCPIFSDGFSDGFERDGVLEPGAYVRLKINAPNLYRFGYSLYNDVMTVSNWQSSYFFKDIPEGPYYFFAENLYNAFAPVISKYAIVFCGDFVFEIISMTETILDNEVDDTWEDIRTEYENTPDFAIISMTETIIATDNTLDTDWTDEITIEADFAIVAITETIL
jgi:hypothetical protein